MPPRSRRFTTLSLGAYLLVAAAQCKPAGTASSPSSSPTATPAVDWQIFAPYGLKTMRGALLDSGGLEKGTELYHEVAPADTTAVAQIVRLAAQTGTPLRVRGAGNSLNSTSLPREGELLVRTQALRAFRRVGPGVVEAGGGVSIFGVRNWLRSYGYDLPVGFNGVGPSVAGFLAGGGISITSKDRGGFWDNVEHVTFVDGRGEVHEVGRDDGVFPWLFGSMGQLGIITAVQLRIVPVGAQKEIPPSGEIGAAWEADTRVNTCTLARHLGRPYWFTVFVPPESRAAAERDLLALGAKFPELMVRPFSFVFPVKYRGLQAPLVYPAQGDFVAVGMWAYVVPEKAERGGLDEFMTAYDAFVRAHPGFRRYIQAEPERSPKTIRASFDPVVYERFLTLKMQMDPHAILNRGVLELSSAAATDR